MIITSNCPAAPSCTTVYEDVCEDVQDEECNTVNDEICEVDNSERCETVQDRRCSVSFSKTCSPNKEQKCDQVVDTINEQACTSRSERKCATVSHPACHVMKVGTQLRPSNLSGRTVFRRKSVRPSQTSGARQHLRRWETREKHHDLTILPLSGLQERDGGGLCPGPGPGQRAAVLREHGTEVYQRDWRGLHYRRLSRLQHCYRSEVRKGSEHCNLRHWMTRNFKDVTFYSQDQKSDNEKHVKNVWSSLFCYCDENEASGFDWWYLTIIYDIENWDLPYQDQTQAWDALFVGATLCTRRTAGASLRRSVRPSRRRSHSSSVRWLMRRSATQ